MKKTNQQQTPPLELLFTEQMRDLSSPEVGSVLDLCLSGTQKEIRSVPLRYRLIALGFVQHLSPEEVNRRLLENDCPRLYARSFWEASVIFALHQGFSYSEWKKLVSDSGDLREEIARKGRAFSGRAISLKDVRRYVEDSSLRETDIAATRHQTREMEKELGIISNGEAPADSAAADYRSFLLSNLDSFSTVREKTRYYFCKYLLYYLDAGKKDCAAHFGKKVPGVDQLSRELPPDSRLLQDLRVFKVLSRLQRKRHTPDEVSEIIEEGALSLGTIYALYSSFYFDYPVHDWIQGLSESGIVPETLLPDGRKRLAEAARRHRPALAGKTDREVLTWLQEEMERLEIESETADVSYQSGREGENYLRKVLRGTLDPDRTTLLSFLLFFGNRAFSEIPPVHRITRERLDAILEDSGFPRLDTRRAFDRFVCGFLKAEDPQAFLLEEAEDMFLSGKSFYLYRSWLLSQSAEKQWGGAAGS